MNKKNISVVILAAGKGKRMNNPDLPKVLALLNNKPLIEYVIELALQSNAAKIVPIIGHHRDKVISFFESKNYSNLDYVIQEEQLGTGHAVLQAEKKLYDFDCDVLILSGDVPLVKLSTIENFIYEHNKINSDLSVLSCYADNPFGYGRILRNENNGFERIVEEKDADENIKKIKEINSGIYLVNSKLLFSALKNIRNNNAQGEFYLTDIVGILKHNNFSVNSFPLADFEELQGVNSQDDLINLHLILKKQKGEIWLSQSTTLELQLKTLNYH